MWGGGQVVGLYIINVDSWLPPPRTDDRQVSALHEALTVPQWWRHERKRLAIQMTSQSTAREPRQALESKAPCHLHPYIGGLPATRVALPQRENVRAEMTHKKGVAEQRNFLCEEDAC